MPLTTCLECKGEFSDSLSQCPKCGYKKPPNTDLKFYFQVAVVLLIGVGAGKGMLFPSPPRTPSVGEIIEQTKQKTFDDLELKSDWYKRGFGNVMIADFTIKNASLYKIKDVKISCSGTAESGTEVSKNSKTIYSVIEPEKPQKFEANMGLINSQTAQEDCKIVDFSLVDADSN